MINTFAALTERWYGIAIGGAMMLCILLAYFILKKRGYNTDIVFNVAIFSIPLAIIGARLYYVLFDVLGGTGTWSYWFKDWHFFGFVRVDGRLKFDGLRGLAIYGGLIFAAIGGYFARLLNKRETDPLKQMTFIQMLDAFFILIILGQAIGRWGNFANGEAYGREITNPALQHFPIAVFIDDEYVTGYFQATFFYEFTLNIIGFAILLWLYLGKRKSYDGFNFSVYCLWYGLGRLIIEGMRSDSLYLGGIKISQLVSVLLICYGAANIIYHVVTAKRAQKKVFIFVDEASLDESYFAYEKTIMYLRKSVAKQQAAIEMEKADEENNA